MKTEIYVYNTTHDQNPLMSSALLIVYRHSLTEVITEQLDDQARAKLDQMAQEWNNTALTYEPNLRWQSRQTFDDDMDQEQWSIQSLVELNSSEMQEEILTTSWVYLKLSGTVTISQRDQLFTDFLTKQGLDSVQRMMVKPLSSSSSSASTNITNQASSSTSSAEPIIYQSTLQLPPLAEHKNSPSQQTLEQENQAPAQPASIALRNLLELNRAIMCQLIEQQGQFAAQQGQIVALRQEMVSLKALLLSTQLQMGVINNNRRKFAKSNTGQRLPAVQTTPQSTPPAPPSHTSFVTTFPQIGSSSPNFFATSQRATVQSNTRTAAATTSNISGSGWLSSFNPLASPPPPSPGFRK